MSARFNLACNTIDLLLCYNAEPKMLGILKSGA